ncbi:MAG: hypothetical protein H6R19_2257 [Proteobacteria bacterium]|nr:hypothetical protein [Pseudomonadota bacterium]
MRRRRERCRGIVCLDVGNSDLDPRLARHAGQCAEQLYAGLQVIGRI